MSLSYAISEASRRNPGALGRRNPQASHRTIPAPVRGWNTRDGLPTMKPDYGVRLDNFFPHRGYVGLRRGYRAHATGLGGAVKSLLSFRSGSTLKLFAGLDAGLYDVTLASQMTYTAEAGLTVTNGRWRMAHFAGRGFVVNGVDEPLRIEADGSVTQTHGWTGTNLTAANLVDVLPFKNRLFFLEKDTATVWYGGVNEIMGTLNPFHLDRVHRGGGVVLGMGTITLEAGVGVDDLICFFMDSGAVLVYGGTDISDADAFGIQGTFQLGRLVSRDGIVNFGPDLVATTSDGYIPMLPFLKQGDRSRRSLALSDAIASAVTDAIETFGSNDGWSAHYYPRGPMLVFNVPIGSGRSEQHIQNAQTGAWCRFTDIPANAWTVHDDKMFFATTGGAVHQFDVGNDDAGSAIAGDAQSAYHYLKHADDKRFSMLRPHFDSRRGVSASVSAAVDFSEEFAMAATASAASAGTQWGTADWGTFKWGGGRVRSRVWKGVNKEGTALSVRVTTNARGTDLRWYATDVLYDILEGV